MNFDKESTISIFCPAKARKRRFSLGLKLGLSFAMGVCFAGAAGYLWLIHRPEYTQVRKTRAMTQTLKDYWLYAPETNPDVLDTQLQENGYAGFLHLADDPYASYQSNLALPEQALSTIASKASLPRTGSDSTLHGLASMASAYHHMTTDPTEDPAGLDVFASSMADTGTEEIGIGVRWSCRKDGTRVIEDVFVNTPADEAGLQPGDILLQASDGSTITEENESFSGFFRSHAGEEILLMFERSSKIEHCFVTPGAYDLSVSCSIQDHYGMISIHHFHPSSAAAFQKAMDQVQKSGVHNLVLDLRGNSGGIVKSARSAASLLVKKDSIIYTKTFRNGETIEFRTTEDTEPVSIEHLYILQDENTASAAEIFIGALKDNLPESAVTLIGSTTYGKGILQDHFDLPDGSGMYCTTAYWNTPKGTNIHETGFAPDIEVEKSALSQIRCHAMEENDVITTDRVDENCSAIQTCLQALGYDSPRNDGYFCDQCLSAYQQFEADEDMEITSSVDAAGFKLLLLRTAQKVQEEGKAADPANAKAIELIESGQ